MPLNQVLAFLQLQVQDQEIEELVEEEIKRLKMKDNKEGYKEEMEGIMAFYLLLN